MKVWIIFVVPQNGVRYIDSIWASKDNFDERYASLRASFTASGNSEQTGHSLRWTEAKLADARLTEEGS